MLIDKAEQSVLGGDNCQTSTLTYPMPLKALNLGNRALHYMILGVVKEHL